MAEAHPATPSVVPAKAGIHFAFAFALACLAQEQEQDGFRLSPE